MSSQISLNPMATTNAKGLFSTNSNGFTQGDAQDDPAVKFALAGGVLSTEATTPLWGGIPVQEFINDSAVLGSTVLQADGEANPTGICVFNQAFAGITTPQSTAPLYSAGMSVNFYRFGSGARIPLALNPASVTLDGDLISTTVYFDYTNNWVTATQPGSQAALPVKVLKISTENNKTVSYSSVTGNANWATDGLIAVVQI
ncbi:MAG: hypothetical protein ACOYMH_00040 [Zwartia sp.]